MEGDAAEILDDEAWRAGVSGLYDRLSRAIDKNSGIQLTAAEVDLIVLTGAFEAISNVTLAEMKRLAAARLAAKR